MYLVHGSKHIAELFKTTQLTVTISYGIVLKHCFAMDDDAVRTYVTDTSGSQKKQIEGSQVSPGDRISYLTYENLHRVFLGSGFEPICDRFKTSLQESWSSAPIGQSWQELPDFGALFEEHVGSAVIKSIFGSEIMAQNPQFVVDLWKYDQDIMSLAQRVPSFWIPAAYRLRDKLLFGVKRWHQSSSRHFSRGDSNSDPQNEAIWGSRTIRERHKMLLGVKNQNVSSVASTDLGLIWA